MKKLEEFLNIPFFFTEENFFFRKREGASTEMFPCFKNDSAEFCMKGDKGRGHPELRPDTEVYLNNLFSPMIEQLYKMTGIMLELSV